MHITESVADEFREGVVKNTEQTEKTAAVKSQFVYYIMQTCLM